MAANPILLRAISGSLRRDSFNTALARGAIALAPEGVTIEMLEYRDVPLYDADLEIPPSVASLKDAIARADGLVIATPEYNFGIPGVLKNMIDWASRPAYRSPLLGKPVAIVSASTSLIGGARAQLQLREVLLGTAAYPFPWPDVVLGRAKEKISEGRVVDETSRRLLGEMLTAFAAEVRLRKSHPAPVPA
jgi:chromate reductase